MDAAKSVTANFTLNTYTLTVSKAGTGSGTVTSARLGSPAAPPARPTSLWHDGDVDGGRRHRLDLRRLERGGCTGTGACVVTMDAAKTCTANFTLNTYTLTVSKAGTGAGTVTSVPAGIACGATCSADLRLRHEVTLTAVASHRFDLRRLERRGRARARAPAW